MTRPLELSVCLAALLSGCAEPAVGHCSGILAGAKFEAEIDQESEHHVLLRQACEKPGNRTRWVFSYGDAALQILALSPEATAGSLSDQKIALPPRGDWFEEWLVVSPEDAASLRGGTMTLPSSILDFAHRLQGSFRMGLADGSLVDCSFELPKADDEGSEAECPDDHPTTKGE